MYLPASFRLWGVVSFALLAISASAAQASSDARLLLYPDIHKDSVVFVYGQDLWTASASGGEAHRLTAHSGRELFPKFSPDGEWIAFSADYSGAHQVWVMPAAGGTPRQLTFYTDVGTMPPRGGYDPWILGWTPDGKILARLNRTPWGQRMGRYYVIDPAGGLEQPLEIPHGGTASFSADGKSLAYTPIDREFRTWKRTMGGRAQDVWIYDFEQQASRRLTTFRGTDNFPMWVGETVFFTSDREFTLEIFAHDLTSDTVRQVTSHDTWDVLWPSQGPENIVFVRGGALHKLDLATEQETPISIRIPGGLPATVPYFEDVSDNIDAASISPAGKRVVFEARGDLFSVPTEHGAIRRLTSTSEVRERNPSWSPDGKWVAYLSDQTGEYEIYVRSHDGKGEPRQLTFDAEVWRFGVAWSPDSKTLAFGDRKRRLFVLDIASRETKLVDSGFRGDLNYYRFSPDSRWLLYQRTREESRLVGLSLYSLDSGEIVRLGDGNTLDFSPVWSHDGKYLFFLSNRDFNLTFSSFEFNYLYNRASRVFAVALDPEAPALFPPRSDEVTPKAEDSAEKDGEKDNKKDEAAEDSTEEVALTIEAEGFMDRTIALPGLEPGNYSNPTAIEGALLVIRSQPGAPGSLVRYDFSERKASSIADAVQTYGLSADGQQVLYLSRGSWHVVAAKAGQKSRKLDLSTMKAKVDPKAEWLQMFDDSWRISRDWFYDPNMHGMDWKAIGERYRALVPHISHRSDLDWILGEMVGELAAGHTYVQSGEVSSVDRVQGGKLGAELVADASGFYRIERIFRGENWHDDYRSPLTEPGVEVAAGEFLIAIDGEALITSDNPYRLLEGKAERLVVLTVNDKPSVEGARDVTIRTLGSEGNLRYIDWVQSRMELADRLSGGRIGYIHLPNTAIEGNRMLQKLFYSQSNKEALIVDDRYNGGGFIPDRMIEYLSRTHLTYWAMRDIDSMRTPAFAHDGPKVMLMNGYSSSGGDALPFYFRQEGLGKLIGTRTWGGLIGLNGNPPLMDGGGPLLCTFRVYDRSGNWVVENEGVVPDIEVHDTAEGLADGGDPSIEAAVEELLKQLEEKPVFHPEPPQPPDLSRQG